MGTASSEARARALLEELGRKPFKFQCELAARCLTTVSKKERLLVAAPTGAGKTLVSQLVIALSAAEQSDRYPRVLIVCPTRALLVQQLVDAGWLRERRIAAIHALTPDLAPSLARATLASWGVVYVMPVTLTNRLSFLGEASALQGFDFAIFDEIDTYLTLDELAERRDTWPALQLCIDAGLPILGFTGTNLNAPQQAAWLSKGFSRVEAEVPDGWMPFTRVRFVGIEDQAVKASDSAIRDQLRTAYQSLESDFGPVNWSQLKLLAEQGHRSALRVLQLCYERLELFESLGSASGKLREIENVAEKETPTLVLSRFRHSARTLLEKMRDANLSVDQADGGMRRDRIERLTGSFRDAAPDEQRALIITRELGGRGLDFPNAGSALMVSPRSNYQAVAQELARIRSRQEHVKEARVLYYADTEEEAKARRLGEHLRRERFRAQHLFEVLDLPTPSYILERFESLNMRHEESLDYRMLTRLGTTPSTLHE